MDDKPITAAWKNYWAAGVLEGLLDRSCLFYAQHRAYILCCEVAGLLA